MMFRVVAAMAIAAFGASQALGQVYPNRPVRVVVAFAPGTTSDIVGRMFADKLTQATGQPFVVENRTGAGGTIGAEFVAKSAPDGYTLLVSTAALPVSAHVYRNLKYDTGRDFASITVVSHSPLAVSSAKRNAMLPDVPSIQEAGVRNFETVAWFGFVAPAGTPADVIARLHGEITKALALPDVRQRLIDTGSDIIGNSPEAADRHLRDEIAKWGVVVRAANVSAN